MVRSNKDLFKYKQLIFNFVSGKVSIEEFATSYMEMIKKEEVIFDEPIFKVLGTLFSDIDAYCDTPELWEDGDINEVELFSRAKKALIYLLDY